MICKKNILDISTEERTNFVNLLDKEAKAFNEKQDEETKAEREKNAVKQNEMYRDVVNKPPHWFTMFKQLTLTGYFNSELGLTKATRYVKIPGKFDGNFPYKKGDKVFTG